MKEARIENGRREGTNRRNHGGQGGSTVKRTAGKWASILSGIILAVLVLPAAGAVLTVGPGGPGGGYDYETIQEAINAAAPGDTIQVAAGTYEADNLAVTRPMTIQSADGAADTIIQAVNPGIIFELSEGRYMTVNTPVGLAGGYPASGAAFGPAAGAAAWPATADIVYADPPLADGPIQNDVAGKIVLIDRGVVPFTTKAEYAQAAGAVGVIIANTDDTLIVMGAGTGYVDEIDIPILMIRKSDADAIKAGLDEGAVNAALQAPVGDITIQGFTLDNGTIRATGVSNVRILDNVFVYRDGPYLMNVENFEIIGNQMIREYREDISARPRGGQIAQLWYCSEGRVVNNSGYSPGVTLFMFSSSNVKVEGNLFEAPAIPLEGDDGIADYGMSIQNSVNIDLVENRFAGFVGQHPYPSYNHGKAGTAVAIHGSTGTITGNTFENNTIGVKIRYSAGFVGEPVVLRNNNFIGNAYSVFNHRFENDSGWKIRTAEIEIDAQYNYWGYAGGPAIVPVPHNGETWGAFWTVINDPEFPEHAVSDQVDTANAYSVPPVFVDAAFDESTPGWGENKFASIQDAIDAAEPGGTVIVAAGTYREQLLIEESLTLRPATVNGEFVAVTIEAADFDDRARIDKGWAQNLYDYIIRVTASDVTIEGFTINGGEGMYDGTRHRHCDGVWRGSAEGDVSRDPRRVGFYGIWYDGEITGGVVRNNTITDVKGWATASIMVSCGAVVAVEGNVIPIHVWGNVGISASQAGTVATVDRNEMAGTLGESDWSQGGIQFALGATGSATSNTVVALRSGTTAMSTGIAVYDGAEVALIRHNTLDNTDTAILVWGPVVTAQVEEIKDNALTNSKHYGIAAYNGGRIDLIENNILDNNDWGIYFLVWNGYGPNETGRIDEIKGNTITDSTGGAILVAKNVGTISVPVVRHNNIDNDGAWGLYNLSGEVVDAAYNYWGAADGPSGEGPGQGDAVSDHVLFDPYYADAGLTQLVYLGGATLDDDLTVEKGETLTVPGTLTVPEGVTVTVFGDLDVGKLDLEDGAVLVVVDGSLTLGTADGGTHTMSGTFTYYNSFGSMYIYGASFKFEGSTLMLISDIHVAPDVTLTVEGSLILDGCTVSRIGDEGTYTIKVEAGGALQLARTAMSHANLTLEGDGSLVRDNFLADVAITVAPGAENNQVFHNVFLGTTALTNNGTGTVTEVDDWGNVTSLDDTRNDLTVVFNQVDSTPIVQRRVNGELVEVPGRTLDAYGNLFIQPGDVAMIDLDVAKLGIARPGEKIQMVEAMLGFHTGYFTAGGDSSLGAVTPWEYELHNAWSADGVYGKIDTAIGLGITHPDPEGTDAEGTVAQVALESHPDVEGVTRFYFRTWLPDGNPWMTGDNPMAGTRLAVFQGTPPAYYLTPFTMNTGYITIDGTDPEIARFTATQEQGGAPVDVFAVAAVTHQGTVTLTVDARDALAGIANDDVILTLTLRGSEPPVTLGSELVSAVEVEEGGETWTRYTFEVEIGAATLNGVYDVEVFAADRSGNLSLVLEGVITVQKNQVAVTVALQGAVAGPFGRAVTFVATDGVGGFLKEWTETLTFTDGMGTVTLLEAPDGMAFLSAKTDWTLRTRVSAVPEEGQAVASFTGDDHLRGGDLNGDNQVDALDFAILRYYWYTLNAAADITGNGETAGPDYEVMRLNWYTTGHDE